jgi:hypothetical protein
VTWVGQTEEEELDLRYELLSDDNAVVLVDDEDSSGRVLLTVDDELSDVDDSDSAEPTVDEEPVTPVDHNELDTTLVPAEDTVELLPNGKGGAELEADRDPAELSAVVRSGIDTELVSVGKPIVMVDPSMVLDMLGMATVDSLTMLDEVVFPKKSLDVDAEIVLFQPTTEEEDGHDQPVTAVPDGGYETVSTDKSEDVPVEIFQPEDGVAELELLSHEGVTKEDPGALPVMLDAADVLVLLVFVQPAVGQGVDVIEQETNCSV